jgi:H+-transporting ATPase
MMYLMLSVAGHLTIFMTRTRGPFWSIRPARILWVAVLGTQILATTIAVLGIFVTPLDWKWAAFVWGYAIVWFLFTDRVKLLGYRILDPVKPSAGSQRGTTASSDDGVSSSDDSASSDNTVAGSDDSGPDTPNPVQGDGTGAPAPGLGAQPATTAAPFHTDTDPDGVYHDNDDCPYGSEIKRHGNDQPGAEDRRLCDWCAHHPVPV